MPTDAGKSGSTLAGEFWGGRLDNVSGTLGFPLARRVSLMLNPMLAAAVGVSRTLLQRLLGSWGFALAFHREVFASLDVSCTATTTLPPSRRCRVNGALLDEPVLVTGLAPLLALRMRLRVALAAASRPGSPCTSWPRRQESTCALIGKAMNHRAAMDAQPLLLRLCSCVGHSFSHRFF